MKKTFSIQKWYYVLALSALLSSCSDDETPISVAGVFVQSVDDTETQLTEIRLGEMVRIHGSGFATTKAIYCNGAEVGGVNRNMITDTDIIFTVTESIPIGGEVENPEDLNTIRIVTEEQSIVYNIPILGHAPSVTGVSHTLPKAGDIIEIYGENLRGLSTVAFPGGVAVEAGDFTESEDYTKVTVTVPEGGDRTPGAICLEGISGGVYTYDYMNVSAGVFLSTFDMNDTYNRADNMLKGTEPIPVNPQGEPGSPEVYAAFPEEPAYLDPTEMDGQNAGWVRFDSYVALNKVMDNPESGITRETSCDRLAFQVDYYMTTPWSCGAFRIELQANQSAYRQTSFSWVENGVVTPVVFTGWKTLTMPCSQVSGMTGKTLGEVADALEESRDGIFMFKLGQFQMNGAGSYYRGTAMSGCQIYFGNIRLVPYAKQSYNNE